MRFSWLLHRDRITSLLIIGKILVPLFRQNYLALIIGKIFMPSLYSQHYLVADHRRDFRAFFIQTELPCRWSSVRFSCLLYTDRITSPLIIGEILVPSLYRQNYPAADRWDSLAFFTQTGLPRRWSSARFSCLLYTDRITLPLIIGEIFVPSL